MTFYFYFKTLKTLPVVVVGVKLHRNESVRNDENHNQVAVWKGKAKVFYIKGFTILINNTKCLFWQVFIQMLRRCAVSRLFQVTSENLVRHTVRNPSLSNALSPFLQLVKLQSLNYFFKLFTLIFALTFSRLVPGGSEFFSLSIPGSKGKNSPHGTSKQNENILQQFY